MFRETPLDSNRMEDLLSELLPCLALALGGSQSTRTAFPQEGSLLTSFQPLLICFMMMSQLLAINMPGNSSVCIQGFSQDF